MDLELIKKENALLNSAIIYATECHKDQLRKGTCMPYIVHPLEVMQILYVMQADKRLMAAGVLHDTVEDTAAEIEDIEKKFGEDIATLVASHTDTHRELSWKERKTLALADCTKANVREQKLVLADKLANIRSMVRDYAVLGEKLWHRFKVGRKEQAWYYHGGVRALQALAQDENAQAAYTEFKNLVYELFGEPEAYINEEDLQDNEFIICENAEKMVSVIINQGNFCLRGEEFGDIHTGSDSYEYTIELNQEATGKLLLHLRQDFGQERKLKDIFKEEICVAGRYYTFLRYCEKYNLQYEMSSF